MEKLQQEFNPKIQRERFNQADVLPRHPSWPKPVGTAPRVGGNMGRIVRNTEGKVVTLTINPTDEVTGTDANLVLNDDVQDGGA